MRNLLLILCITGLSYTLTAQASFHDEITQKFVHYIDPYGLVIIESIGPGMTLYGLSKKYNVRLDSILEKNPDLKPDAIPLGFPVHIPIYSKAISFEPPAVAGEGLPLFYRVQPKETLYRISKVYLDVSPETIVSLNPRTDQGLNVGQVLHLGWYTPQQNDWSPIVTSSSQLMDTANYSVVDFETTYKTEGKLMKTQKGLAVWKPGNTQSHYYVLHPTALVGSYMEVTNPMLHRTLTAKVAGNIPPGLYQSHVGLVVSPSLARALGVLDQQFFAQWRFVE